MINDVTLLEERLRARGAAVFEVGDTMAIPTTEIEKIERTAIAAYLGVDECEEDAEPQTPVSDASPIVVRLKEFLRAADPKIRMQNNGWTTTVYMPDGERVGIRDQGRSASIYKTVRGERKHMTIFAEERFPAALEKMLEWCALKGQ